jgi:hypothetical protein
VFANYGFDSRGSHSILATVYFPWEIYLLLEVKFWKRRRDNLELLKRQVDGPKLNISFLDLDIRAMVIAIWAVQDVGCVVSCGQVLSVFNALLQQPSFVESFQRKYPHIIQIFRHDVEEVSLTFREGKGNPPQLQGVPITTSALIWCKGLEQRLKNSWKRCG